MSERQRYVGTETEFVLFTSDEGLSVDDSVSLMMSAAVDLSRSPGRDKYNELGARVYDDVGSHPEYATPECFKPRDVVRHEMIGEQFMISAFERALGYSRDYGQPYSVFSGELSKKTTLNGETCGAHENYQVRRENFGNLGREPVWQSVAAHLVSRVVYTGGGGYNGENYHISPRANFHHDDIGSNTTRNRPVINTRDEPLVRASDTWGRLHVITGDASMSPWAIYMKLGPTALVTKAMEQGVRFDDLGPVDPARAFRIFGADTTLSRSVVCNDGSRRAALNIQEHILKRIQDRQIATSEDELLVMDEWHQALRSLQRLRSENRLVSFLNSIDWFARWRIIEEKSNTNGHNPHKLDRLYDKLTDDMGRGGIGKHLREKGAYRLTPDDWSLESAIRAQSSPRAMLRGEVVKLSLKAKAETTVNWVGAKGPTQNGLQRFPDFPSPEQTSDYIQAFSSAITSSYTLSNRPKATKTDITHNQPANQPAYWANS